VVEQFLKFVKENRISNELVFDCAIDQTEYPVTTTKYLFASILGDSVKLGIEKSAIETPSIQVEQINLA
jgi:hypothetical protein